MMKRKNEAGFSLIEVLVSITILAAVVLPTCSALVLGIQLNDKTDALMRAQLSVSSAVETLMAEGITPDDTAETLERRFPEVTITISPKETYDGAAVYYNVTVASKVADANEESLVKVSTVVNAVPAESGVTPPAATLPESEVEE